MRVSLLLLLIFASSFLYYLHPIVVNKPHFTTDEMYWISTARVVHMLWNRDTKNNLWHEYYGFTNLNGAKLMFGVGLSATGKTDVSQVGIAPQTYYKWTPYEGQPFPTNHNVFPLIVSARLISALFVAGAVSLLYYFSLHLGLTHWGAVFAAGLMTIHPTSYYIATHVFSDGIFIFFQILLLYLLWHPDFRHKHKLLDCFIGIVFAFLISTKLNGLLFGPFILFVYIRARQRVIQRILWFCVSTVCALILINPNFIFYPSYNLIQILKDRIQITQEHIAYFSNIDPDHVTLSIQSRLASLLKHTLSPLFTILMFTGLLLIIRESRLKLFLLLSLYIVGCVLSYTVFDEIRYYYPFVPFVAVFCAYGLEKIIHGIIIGHFGNPDSRLAIGREESPDSRIQGIPRKRGAEKSGALPLKRDRDMS